LNGNGTIGALYSGVTKRDKMSDQGHKRTSRPWFNVMKDAAN
jgi:hypothetical protein